MEANYSNYDIEIADIWQFEHCQFLYGRTSEDLAKKIINKAEDLIISKGEESFKVDLSGNIPESNWSYNIRNLNDYKRASKTLVGRYEINYFFNKNSCYQFDQEIIIKQEYPNFDFWFALKLRQYNSKLREIKNLLNSQLQFNFNHDTNKLISFLKEIIRQYQSEFIENRIVETVEDWINQFRTKKPISTKGQRKMDGKINSFLLKAVRNDPKYFHQIHIRKIYLEILLDLKKEKFISSNVGFDDFIAILSNKEISKKKRIIWIGNNIELSWFVKYLVNHSNKLEVIKNDKWPIALKCFVKSNGTDYSEVQLRQASGKKLDRKEKLESILSRI